MQQDAQFNERTVRDIQDSNKKHFALRKGQHDDFEITF